MHNDNPCAQPVKKVPNPNGKNGGDLHQGKIAEYEKKLKDKGWDVEKEVRVDTKGGHKDTRYLDLRATKDGKTLDVQVGKRNKNGTPVSRERKAISDVNQAKKETPNGGTKTIFVPCN